MILKIIVAIVLILFVLFCTWALMKTHADSEIIEERLFQKHINEKNGLKNRTDISSDLNELERQSFDKLMDEFDKNMEVSKI